MEPDTNRGQESSIENRVCVSLCTLSKIDKSDYIKPYRFSYVLNGRAFYHDLSIIPEAASIIIYDVSKNSLVFVKQFRPGVYLFANSDLKSKLLSCSTANGENSYPSGETGITIELCSGYIDKEKSALVGAARELFEETGYQVQKERLELVRVDRNSNGCVEVTQKEKVSHQHGLHEEGEDIELIYLPVTSPSEMAEKIGKKASNLALMSIYWFFFEKYSKKINN